MTMCRHLGLSDWPASILHLSPGFSRSFCSQRRWVTIYSWPGKNKHMSNINCDSDVLPLLYLASFLAVLWCSLVGRWKPETEDWGCALEAGISCSSASSLRSTWKAPCRPPGQTARCQSVPIWQPCTGWTSSVWSSESPSWPLAAGWRLVVLLQHQLQLILGTLSAWLFARAELAIQWYLLYQCSFLSCPPSAVDRARPSQTRSRNRTWNR